MTTAESFSSTASCRSTGIGLFRKARQACDCSRVEVDMTEKLLQPKTVLHGCRGFRTLQCRPGTGGSAARWRRETRRIKPIGPVKPGIRTSGRPPASAVEHGPFILVLV